MRILLAICVFTIITGRVYAQQPNIQPYTKEDHIRIQAIAQYNLAQYIQLPIRYQNSESSFFIEWSSAYSSFHATRRVGVNEFRQILYTVLSADSFFVVNKKEYDLLSSKLVFDITDCKKTKYRDTKELLGNYFDSRSVAKNIDGCVFAKLVNAGYIIYRDDEQGIVYRIKGEMGNE